jgi:hydroxymethylbilane synthase
MLLHARPDCEVVPIRGNVATRLAKLAAGEADATFLAAAGLNRLGESGTGHPLPAEDWLPAPGQAAIAIECRADDAETQRLLAAIDHAPSRHAVLAERALLAALGGNCHSPVAVLTTQTQNGADGELLTLRAVVFSPDGSERADAEATFAATDRTGPARLAAELLKRAAPAITVHFTGPHPAEP